MLAVVQYMTLLGAAALGMVHETPALTASGGRVESIPNTSAVPGSTVSRGRSSRSARSQCSTSTPTLARRSSSPRFGKSFGGGGSMLATGLVGALGASSADAGPANAEDCAADEPPPASLSQPPTTAAPPASATAA